MLALALAPVLPSLETAFELVPRQSGNDTCGYAVLAGVIELHRPSGMSLTGREAFLRATDGASGDTKGGVLSFADMCGILADYGIGSFPLRIGLAELLSAIEGYGPAIVHLNWPTPHFILGLASAGDGIMAADPEWGLRVFSKEELVVRYSGFALFTTLENSALRADARFRDVLRETLTRQKWLEASVIRGSGGGNASEGASKAASASGGDFSAEWGAELSGAESRIRIGLFWSPFTDWYLSLRADTGVSGGTPAFVSGVETRIGSASTIRHEFVGLELSCGIHPFSLAQTALTFRVSELRAPAVFTASASFGPILSPQADGIQPVRLSGFRWVTSIGCLAALSPDLAFQTTLEQGFAIGGGNGWMRRLESGFLFIGKTSTLYMGALLDTGPDKENPISLKISLVW